MKRAKGTYYTIYFINCCVSPAGKRKEMMQMDEHYAIIGIAAGVDVYPLYYDACNEKGLSIAGLNI